MGYLIILGSIASFFGTILLSTGLIRDDEQIRDEEATYWGSNPYKTTYSIKDQPFYRYGFRLLIIGFSINIGVGIFNVVTVNDKVLVTALLSVALSAIGIFLLQVFENKKRLLHQDFKHSHHKKVVLKLLRKCSTEATNAAANSSQKEVQDYKIFKENNIKQLQNLQKNLDATFSTVIRELIDDLDNSKDFTHFLIVLSDFLKQQEKEQIRRIKLF